MDANHPALPRTRSLRSIVMLWMPTIKPNPGQGPWGLESCCGCQPSSPIQDKEPEVMSHAVDVNHPAPPRTRSLGSGVMQWLPTIQPRQGQGAWGLGSCCGCQPSSPIEDKEPEVMSHAEDVNHPAPPRTRSLGSGVMLWVPLIQSHSGQGA